MGNQPSAEPHIARRAVRYAAAKNATQAIQRQFPGLFVAQVATQASAQAVSTQLLEDADDVSQAN